MIRVAFNLCQDSQWLGGINYFRNLIRAIYDNKSEYIKPIIFAGTKCKNNFFEDLPPIEIIESSYFDRYSASWFLQRLGGKYLGRNYLLDKILQKYNIDVLSHSPLIGVRSSIPTIGWIPDFQHVRLKKFFSKKEIVQRDKLFKSICQKSTNIIVSSYTARKDLLSFAPEYYSKSKVLQFTVKPLSRKEIIGLSDLQKTYNFSGPYFHLPNQFWVHKNHLIVIEALRILKSKNKKIKIISTGSKNDYREPEHFTRIIRKLEKNDLVDNFKILGIIPYKDMISLMFHSVAAINPSLFEGWSTTVEEAKSLGSRIILSDIDTHREQNPEESQYFNPYSAEELAEILWKNWISYDLNYNNLILKKSFENFLIRWHSFADNYYKILLNCMR